MKITKVTGREIFDSRGIPTVECTIQLEDGRIVVASVPSGTSRGSHEVQEVRDGGTRLGGMGVLTAVDTINRQIQPMLIGREPSLLQTDTQLIQADDTRDKSGLGANAMLAVSMAVLKAQAVVENLQPFELIAYLSGDQEVSLPSPMFNFISGGVHANNNLRIQEFMVMPIGMATFRLAMEAGVSLFHVLREGIEKSGRLYGISDEGGLIVDFRDEKEAFDALCEAIARIEREYEGNFMLVVDVAATQFYAPGLQQYSWGNQRMKAEDLIEYYSSLIKQYPIYAIEDGLGEDDVIGWQNMYKALGSQIQLIGDDLFVTDPQRIWEGTVEKQLANAVIIKPNQIGTMTETLQAIKLCKERGVQHIISHRSGETNDTLIADLAVGTCSTQIKAGSCIRGERIAKYNRLLTIEDELLEGQF